jgi:hypothetical protein
MSGEGRSTAVTVKVGCTVPSSSLPLSVVATRTACGGERWRDLQERDRTIGKSFYNIDLLGFRLALAWSDIDSLSSIAPCNVEGTLIPFLVPSAILSAFDLDVNKHYRVNC